MHVMEASIRGSTPSKVGILDASAAEVFSSVTRAGNAWAWEEVAGGVYLDLTYSWVVQSGLHRCHERGTGFD